MALKKWNWQRFKDILKNEYRFQIIDEDHYDIKFDFILKPMNILIATGLLLFFFTMLNFMLIAFTPLKQYIPGYGSTTGRKNLLKLNIKTDQLESNIESGDKYIKNLQNILGDKMVVETVKMDIEKVNADTGLLSVKTNNEQTFIADMEKGLQNSELNANIQESKQSILASLAISAPSSGTLVSAFNTAQKNGVVFSAQKDESILAPITGMVIWDNPTDGTIALQAENQIVCILKNNSKLLKKTGNFVQKGDALAVAGFNTSSKASTTILELWYKGQALDATKYIKK